MPIFSYQARDRRNAHRSEQIQARDARDALQQIRAAGWTPLKLHQRPPQPGGPTGERDSVTCGWCHTHFATRPAGWECLKCGAPLPLPASPDRGPPPPPPSRSLPARRKAPATHRFSVMIGVFAIAFALLWLLMAAIFGAASFTARIGLVFAVLFMACGIGFVARGVLAIRGRERALRDGHAVFGFVEDVRLDELQHYEQDGPSPFVLRFQYVVNNVSYFGETTTLDSTVQSFYPGEPIWIVSVTEEPEQCSIWPPLATPQSGSTGLPTFRYHASDSTGVAISATIAGVNGQQAATHLAAYGLRVHQLHLEQPVLPPQSSPSSTGQSSPSSTPQQAGQLNWQRPQAVVQAEKAVTCSWCSVAFTSPPANGLCSNCGAQLPLSRVADRGPEPSYATPRRLSPGVSRRLLWRRNEDGLFGLILLALAGLLVLFTSDSTGALIAAAVFLLLGMIMTVSGFRKALRHVRALRFGQPSSSHVIDVTKSLATTFGNDVAHRVRYQFTVNGMTHQGKLSSTNTRVRAHQPGAPVWVVHLPDDVNCNALWPPCA